MNEVLLDHTLSCNDSGSSSQSSASPCIGITSEPSTVGVSTTGAIIRFVDHITNATPSHNPHAITTTVTLHPLDPPIIVAAPLFDAVSYNAELEVCEEQQAHIASSLVRKSLKKKKAGKGMTLRKLKLSPPLNPMTPVAQILVKLTTAYSRSELSIL